MRRGGLPSDLAADEVERPLEPGDLQERVVVGWINVAALELLANDLLHPADAEPFGGGDGANRLPADEAGEMRRARLCASGPERMGLADGAVMVSLSAKQEA